MAGEPSISFRTAPTTRPAAAVGAIVWWQWLVLGACFAIGHGVAQRLIDFRPDEAPGGFQNFGVKPFPGESLEALKRRHPAQSGSLLADFDELERQKRNQQEKAAFDQRRNELEQSQRDEEERLRREAEAVRLDALDGEPAPQERGEPAAESGFDSRPEPRSEPPPVVQEVPPPPARPAEPAPSLPPLPQAPPAPSPAARP